MFSYVYPPVFAVANAHPAPLCPRPCPCFPRHAADDCVFGLLYGSIVFSLLLLFESIPPCPHSSVFYSANNCRWFRHAPCRRTLNSKFFGSPSQRTASCLLLPRRAVPHRAEQTVRRSDSEKLGSKHQKITASVTRVLLSGASPLACHADAFSKHTVFFAAYFVPILAERG